jgi:methanogenic corrinoid protein MtbC1
MNYMSNVIERMKGEGIYGRVKTFVGGAPVTARFAAEIGAHGYGKDAAAAVAMAKELIEAKR